MRKTAWNAEIRHNPSRIPPVNTVCMTVRLKAREVVNMGGGAYGSALYCPSAWRAVIKYPTVSSSAFIFVSDGGNVYRIYSRHLQIDAANFGIS